MEHYNLLEDHPILVRWDKIKKKYAVKDGQHRFKIAMEKKALIYYYKSTIDDAEISVHEQIMLANSASRNWSSLDVLKSYSAAGNANYTNLLNLSNTVNLSITQILKLLDISNGAGLTKFRKGKFKYTKDIISMVKKGDRMYNTIMNNLSKYTRIGNKSYVIEACRDLLKSNLNVNLTELDKAFGKYGYKFTQQGSPRSYKLEIIDVYNHRRKKDRITI